MYKPNRSAKLTWPQVQWIREKYSEGWSQGRISREVGISLAQIGKIVRHEAWTDAPPEAPTPVEFDASASASAVQKLLEQANEEARLRKGAAESLDELGKGDKV